jgi:hypothetical protein
VSPYRATLGVAGHAAKHGKPKALSILAHKVGRTVYFLLARERAFEMKRFLAA